MASIQQLEEGIRRADAAGDSEGVRVLGQQLMTARQQAQAPQPGIISQLERQVGLTARYIPEGLAQLGGIVSNPLNTIVNKGLELAGSKYRLGTDLGGAMSQQLDRAGLPKPANATERIVGDASRAVVSTAPFIGAGMLASKSVQPVVRAIGGVLSSSPAPQAGYAALSGGSTSAAKEIGAPPSLQVAAGLGIPMLVSGGISAVNALRTPKTVQAANTARDAIAQAMTDDAINPQQAGQAITDANARGVPLSLSDLGDNLRGMTGSVSRKPGLSRTLVRDMVDTRQAAQGDRIRNAISRDLGDIVNPFEQSDALMATARRNAAPLYEQAYSAPPIGSPVLDDLLSRPAGAQALARARTIAANEGRDPTALGFVLDNAGNVVLQPSRPMSLTSAGVDGGQPVQQPSYTPQTLDYVKRGLDDIIEAQRNPITRQLHLDESGRAINGVRADLLNEMDRLNPAYAQARAAYAGPASARQALDVGSNALNYSDQQIEQATSRLSEGDRQQFALGFRSAMSDALDRATDGADKVGRLLGNPRKRQALAQVFGGEDGLQNFLQTMADERMANETYRTVRTGSPTAERLSDDQGNALEQGAQALYNIGSGNKVGLIRQGFGLYKDFRRFGAGEAAQRAREQAAALLTETDPNALRQSLGEAARQEALRQQILALQKRNAFGTVIGGYVALPQRQGQ